MIKKSDVKLPSITKIEKDIDLYIKECIKDDRDITVDISEFSGKQIELIISRYKEGGWKVRLIEDYRDGDYLHFS